ncbi:MAG TPA: thioredoxin domain-containing protein [bacterium]|nr:thioredoxin domain-containing protein [bacterium]
MKKSLLLFSLALLQACGGGQPSQPASAPAPVAGGSKTVVAELDGEKITEANLDEIVAGQLAQIQTQIYEIKRQGLDTLIDDRLLTKEAKKRGITVDQLLKVEILEKVGTISDEEVKLFFEDNKARLQGRSLEELKEPIRSQLLARKTSLYRMNFLDRLRSASSVKILLAPPKVDVGVDDDPSKGPKGAKVTIIEFTDYQCPFCSKVRPTVKQLVADYGDKIHYVLRDFPLDFHPAAKKAAEAAQCAGDQGKYWEYSDVLWNNQKSLEVTELKAYATGLSLDQKKFDACLDEGKYSAEVDKDLADGAKAGVNGTPTFFINGRSLSGALPVEQFKKIIDAELAGDKS